MHLQNYWKTGSNAYTSFNVHTFSVCTLLNKGILKNTLSTLIEEYKTAIHIFNIFKLNVVKIFSLNST